MGVRKATLVSGLVAIAAAVAFAATAFACTALATLQTPPVATGGNPLSVTGSAFSPSGSPVVIHWNSLSGPEVGRATPDGLGHIATSVNVPAASPGHYLLVATQADADGRPVQGTPARASVAIAGANGEVPAAPVAAAPTSVNNPPASPGDSGLGVLTIALAACGAALVVSGMVLARQRRRPERAAAARY